MSHAIDLKPEHLPAEVRQPLEDYLAAAAAANELQNRLVNTPRMAEAYGPMHQEHERLTAQAGAARTSLTQAAQANARRMSESAADHFASAVDRARTALSTAEAELRDAATAAALLASVRPGRAVLNTDTAEARDSRARQRAMAAVSAIREIELPELD